MISWKNQNNSFFMTKGLEWEVNIRKWHYVDSEYTIASSSNVPQLKVCAGGTGLDITSL